MFNLAVKSIALLLLPTVILVLGSFVMGRLSRRDKIITRLNDNADAADRKMIGLRYFGYDTDAVGRQWGALDQETRGYVRLALEIDLTFPFFYGGALTAALLLAWAMLGRPFQPAWLMAPIAITMVADWIENLVQLSQLRLFDISGKPGLQSRWIHVASTATVTKLFFYSVSSLLLIGLVAWILTRGIVHRS